MTKEQILALETKASIISAFKLERIISLTNCDNCDNCDYCNNQSDAKYMVMNVQLTEEEYIQWKVKQ